jgi:hypothetical protein
MDWRLTPCRWATCSSASPRHASAIAVKMLLAPLTLPGSTSAGSTRSRRPHASQRARATAIRWYPSSVCNPRDTKVSVRRKELLPQREQQHSESSSCHSDTSPLLISSR